MGQPGQPGRPSIKSGRDVARAGGAAASPFQNPGYVPVKGVRIRVRVSGKIWAVGELAIGG